ncbi:MAG: HD domain-containing protein [Candidatus Pacebacteria bacterium]|nr:HD domain-containing protein [Candidatus Paceibacterota bacterium]MDD5357148.1 HD domain-containing protein [Candidatus Paceibacterota bacterium]
MLNKITLLQIKKLGVEIDWNDAFAGKSKGNKHLFRVVKLAKFMAQKLRANVSIVEAGAWLHDTALPSGNDYDSEKNKQIVKDILKNVDLSEEELEKVSECVACHEGTGKATTLEAKIVHDADVLEKSGILGIIRHTWKLTNSGKISPENITEGTAKDILDHLKWRRKKLQTPLGKKIQAYLTVPVTSVEAQEIISTASEKAAKSIVTEKIADSLFGKLTNIQKERLKEQLNMGYLKKF